MATVINMPRLSDTMEEGVVAKWLVKKGDKISEGDILAEIETDKATMEFESFYDGILLHIGIEEGETAPVDKLLAIIGDEGEDISGLLNGSTTSSSSDEPKEEKVEETNTSSEASAEIPEGVEVITMPRLSDTMEEGTVASWLKKVGETVEEGDILAEIETDKATMEFESFYNGTLLHIGIEEGQTAPVDALLAIIGLQELMCQVLRMGVSQKLQLQQKLKTHQLLKKKSQLPLLQIMYHLEQEYLPSPLAKRLLQIKELIYLR